MNDSYSKWSDVRAEGRAVDPRPPAEQAAGKAIARERQEAYIRGQQLAEMRQAAEITQADLAASPGVPQARVSKIEHGENSGIDIVPYIDALGGEAHFRQGVLSDAAARRPPLTLMITGFLSRKRLAETGHHLPFDIQKILIERTEVTPSSGCTRVD